LRHLYIAIIQKTIHSTKADFFWWLEYVRIKLELWPAPGSQALDIVGADKGETVLCAQLDFWTKIKIEKNK
jgi:hypothetical protein